MSVANGIDIVTGAVNQPNVVPAGATAVSFTLTVTDTTARGWLSANPGDATGVGASTINWFATGQTMASGTLTKLDGIRQLSIWAGGIGSTHFIIDITSYSL